LEIPFSPEFVRFDTPGPLLLDLWSRLSRLPAGARLFSWVLGRMVPYSGTVRPRVVTLAPGEVEVLLPDRRRVRNHLASVHAVALVNLGELASGLAITTALAEGVRGIPIRLETEFLKKARGDITAHARFIAGPVGDDTDVTLQVPLVDRENELVARVTATWRLRGEWPRTETPPRVGHPEPPTPPGDA
jgi:acyl-coenzyme A thioesterase PaaI-like protein